MQVNFTNVKIGDHVSDNLSRDQKNSVDTEFYECKTEMDRMNVTSVMQSLSL